MTSLDDLDLFSKPSDDWPPAEVVERELWRRHVGRIVRGPECWEWTGTRDSKGYGRITINRRDIPAHRALYADYLGRPLGRWELVLHRCGNEACVRPDHLYVGTQADNARDRDRHGRTSRGEAHARRVVRPDNHILTDAQAAEIRGTYTGRFGEQKAIAVRYGVDPSVISRLVRGKRYV